MSIQGDDNDNRFEIHEMFMAEAGDKCFYGTLSRSQDANGQPHLFSRISVNDGLIQACARDLRLLGRVLDELCVMYLNGLHHDDGVYLIVHSEKYFLN